MQPATQLGEYQLADKLGEGGMGAVYKALHTKLRRTVALKVLPKDRLGDPQAVARFEREMAAVGALDHPNIVRAMDAREVEGTRFLVMEFVEGVDLNAVCRACHPVPVADACEIIRQAALALQHAHEHSLVHRDVKPSNLMITADGVVKLLDLGLARFEEDQAVGEEVTGTGQVMGTIDYMAPEQVADARSVDIRADVYSLGCTLYKLLAARAPFAGPEYRTVMQKLVAHAQAPVPPVRQLRPDVPAELVQVLDRMLAKQPDHRLKTPSQVADAVGTLAMGSNLRALVARAQGRPAPEPGPAQQLTATQELASPSQFTQFIQQIVEESDRSIPPPLPDAARPHSKRLILAGSIAAAVVCVVAVLVWGIRHKAPKQSAGQDERPRSGVAGEPASHASAAVEKSFLLLQWPADEREGATCELDGQAQNMERLELIALGGEIKLSVAPGEHKLLIKRLGYEPFEQSFSVTQGKEVAIRPAWKELPTIARKDAAPPASADKPPPATDKPPAPAEKPAMTKADAPAKPEPSKPVAAAPQPKPASPTPVPPDSPDVKRQEELDANYRAKLDPVEKLAAAWDFRGAAVELGKIRFDESELTAQLSQRREQFKRLYDLKQRVIAAINAANPPMKKNALGVKGMGGDVVKADDAGLTCKLISGRNETLGWADLGPKAMPKLAQLVVDRTSADDWIAAGLLGLVSQDPVFAERSFDQARGLGAPIDPYLTPLTSAAFGRARELLDKGQFAEAETILARLEAKYATTAWYRSHRSAVDAALFAVKAGAREAEAESLYAEAVDLFAREEFYDLKPIVQKLKTGYPTARLLSDAARKPAFAELEKATANLGKRLIVRQDGKGDFTSIQRAVEAAVPNDLVEIQDAGPYQEKLVIAKRLEIRGSRKCWPILLSQARTTPIGSIVDIRAEGARLAHVAIVNGDPREHTPCCVHFRSPATLRSVIVWGNAGDALNGTGSKSGSHVIDSLVLSPVSTNNWPAVFQNCLMLGGLDLCNGSDVRRCISGRGAHLWNSQHSVLDSVLRDVVIDAGTPPYRIDNCAFLKPGIPGEAKNCFVADPLFRDPANLDFRLMPSSPCIGKASDGGDIGVRYTPEMTELCKVALELRRRGFITF